MDKTSIGDRMKDNYEKRNRTFLTRRTPVIIRLDGVCFHTYTKGFEKPFSDNLKNAMVKTTQALCDQIMGAVVGYTQSDEISILLTDFNKFNTQAWYDYNVQKLTSVAASIATAEFNKAIDSDKLALFDARCFNIPKEEVRNYFVWRQKDWERNSIQMLAQNKYSQKQLHKKNTKEMKSMLDAEHGIIWGDLEPVWKTGSTIVKDEAKNWVEAYPRFDMEEFKPLQSALFNVEE